MRLIANQVGLHPHRFESCIHRLFFPLIILHISYSRVTRSVYQKDIHMTVDALSGIRTRATTLATLHSTHELITLADIYHGLVV